MGKRRHAASGRLGRGCPRLRLGPQKARAAPPPASSLQLFRRRRAALRQAAAALHHTRCTCRAACRLRVPVEHAADRRLRGRKITGLPARARHDERRAPPWPVRSRAYHLKKASRDRPCMGRVQCTTHNNGGHLAILQHLQRIWMGGYDGICTSGRQWLP